MSYMSERDVDARNAARFNPVAKHGLRVNRAATHRDRKRELRRTERTRKHKGASDE